MNLKNTTVNFRICDIFYPDYQQILFQLHGNDVLCGRITDVSETGVDKTIFVEIEVKDIQARVIVPIDRILNICE